PADDAYKKYLDAVEPIYMNKPKIKTGGGTVNPTITFEKKNETMTYQQNLQENRNRAKAMEDKVMKSEIFPKVIPPKGDVSKLILPDTGGGGTVNPTLKRNEVRTNYDYMTDREAAVYKYY